jgi:hypothetical protein
MWNDWRSFGSQNYFTFTFRREEVKEENSEKMERSVAGSMKSVGVGTD